MKYEIEDAHPAYRPLITRTIDDLLDQYPWCPLRAVRIYRRKPGDRSMGNTTEDGVISLNPYWFARDPAILEEAGRKQPSIVINGVTLGWHGDMRDEPRHVLTHEFGHALTGALPGWERWAKGRWRAAVVDPGAAPSGYALGSSIEFMAEAFAAYHLGAAPPAAAQDMEMLINGAWANR